MAKPVDVKLIAIGAARDKLNWNKPQLQLENLFKHLLKAKKSKSQKWGPGIRKEYLSLQMGLSLSLLYIYLYLYLY